MKVVQSTWVRYHHFDLAAELNRLGVLERIFTCLPQYKAKQEARVGGIPFKRIECNPWWEAARRVLSRARGDWGRADAWLAVQQTRGYQAWVERRLPDCDVYFALSGSGAKAGALAEKRGASYIMDRGSTHIAYQDRVLQEEYDRWGVERRRIHPWLIENEETEVGLSRRVTVPSRYVKQSFVEMGTPESKVEVVPYGVDTSLFFRDAEPPEDQFVITFVGSFSLRKGAPYVLQAFKDLKIKNKKLLVIGSVPEESRGLISRFGAGGVEFKGPVPRSEVRSFMSRSHVLLLPSIEEGLALVQAQAMACGCPVVATKNTGAEEIIEDGEHGFIVPARCPESIVAALTELADNPTKRNEMSESCIARASEMQGWSEYCDSVLRVMRDAISEKSRG